MLRGVPADAVNALRHPQVRLLQDSVVCNDSPCQLCVGPDLIRCFIQSCCPPGPSPARTCSLLDLPAPTARSCVPCSWMHSSPPCPPVLCASPVALSPAPRPSQCHCVALAPLPCGSPPPPPPPPSPPPCTLAEQHLPRLLPVPDHVMFSRRFCKFVADRGAQGLGEGSCCSSGFTHIATRICVLLFVHLLPLSSPHRRRHAGCAVAYILLDLVAIPRFKAARCICRSPHNLFTPFPHRQQQCRRVCNAQLRRARRWPRCDSPAPALSSDGLAAALESRSSSAPLLGARA